MEERKALFEGQLIRSRHLDYFQNAEDFFVYHNLFGYILKMSEDLVEFLEFFNEARDAQAVEERFGEVFGEELLQNFLSVFRPLACLLVDGSDFEREKALGMYPVQARWITAHAPAVGGVQLFVYDNQSRDAVSQIDLDSWESSLWRLLSGEVTVSEIVEVMRGVEGSPLDGVEDKVLATLAQWSHCDVQAVKLSAEAGNAYKHKRFGVPPYLISTMPYPKVSAMIDAGRAEELRVGPSGLKRIVVDEEVLKLDRMGNRLSSYLSEAHEVLGGKGYGERVFEIADEICDFSGEKVRVLEIGGGLGESAAAFAWCFGHKYGSKALEYVIFSPDESYCEVQKSRVSSFSNVHVQVGDPNKLGSEVEGVFDFIICDEFLANLESVAVRKMVFGDVSEEEESEGAGESEDLELSTEMPGGEAKITFMGEGDSVHQIFKFKLNLSDAPEDFYLNTGSLRLLSEIDKVSHAKTQILLIEFGQDVRYPEPSFEEGEVSFSQHFGVLKQAAKHLGYDGEIRYWMELLGLKRELEMFATTRSQFKAMRTLFAQRGVKFERRAYSRAEFEKLLEESGLKGSLVEVNFEPAEDRIMGLVPHSYRVLRLFKS